MGTLVASRVVLWLLTVLGAVSPVGEPPPQNPAANEDEEPVPQIEVDLLEPIGSIKGIEWPRRDDGPAISTAFDDEPHEVAVSLPGGATLRHASRMTWINQESGKVTDVHIVPQMEPQPAQKTIARLEQILNDWDAKLEDVSAARVAKWKKYGDVPPSAFVTLTGGAIIMGEDKADIFFKMRSNDAGWYLSVTIQATMETRRALRDPDAKPPKESKCSGEIRGSGSLPRDK